MFFCLASWKNVFVKLVIIPVKVCRSLENITQPYTTTNQFSIWPACYISKPFWSSSWSHPTPPPAAPEKTWCWFQQKSKKSPKDCPKRSGFLDVFGHVWTILKKWSKNRRDLRWNLSEVAVPMPNKGGYKLCKRWGDKLVTLCNFLCQAVLEKITTFVNTHTFGETWSTTCILSFIYVYVFLLVVHGPELIILISLVFLLCIANLSQINSFLINKLNAVAFFMVGIMPRKETWV